MKVDNSGPLSVQNETSRYEMWHASLSRSDDNVKGTFMYRVLEDKIAERCFVFYGRRLVGTVEDSWKEVENLINRDLDWRRGREKQVASPNVGPDVDAV